MPRFAIAIVAGAVLLSSSCTEDGPALDPALEHARWVAARDWEITVFEGSRAVRTLTSGHRDWKPVWSAAGDRIVFFRALHEDGLSHGNWRTKICVIDADGTGFRELTTGAYPDFNPTWTRDGTNRILFNRQLATGPNGFHLEMYVTTPDAEPGDEVLIPGNDHEYQFVNSGLRDGRLLVDGVQWRPETSSFDIGVWLLTADGEGGWRWDEVARPFANLVWHKVTVSPSETRVAFMLDPDHPGNLADYSDDVLYWAEFDPVQRTVWNPVAVTAPTGGGCTNEYPRWSPDEQFLVYDSNCATGLNEILAYRLADGSTSVLAGAPDTYFVIPSFAGVPQ